MMPVSPVVKQLELFEVVFGAGQPEYTPLPALIGKAPEHSVISRWELTDDERRLIADGGSIFLIQSTFGDYFHPVNLVVGTGTEEHTAIVAAFGLGEHISQFAVDSVVDKIVGNG